MAARNETLNNRPVSLNIRDGMIWVTLHDKRVIAAPLNWFPWLADAAPEQQKNFELHPLSIYWPDLDDGLDIEALLTGNWTTPMGENQQAEPG